MTLTLTDISAGEVQQGPIQYNFDAIETAVNNGVTALGSDSVTAAAHADLSGNTTKTFHATQGIKITDTANYYGASTQQEQVNNMIGAALGMAAGVSGNGKFIGYSYHASVSTSCTVTIPANSAATAIIVIGRAYMGESTNQLYCPGTFVINSTTVPGIDFTVANIVKFGTAFGGGAGTDGVVPLNLKIGAGVATDLSTVGVRDYQFELSVYIGGAGGLTADRFTMLVYAV